MGSVGVGRVAGTLIGRSDQSLPKAGLSCDEKVVALPKSQNDICHIDVPLVHCKPFHHPVAHLCAKIGALDPSNNKNGCLEIWMQQQLQATERTFSPQRLFFSKSNVFYARIIVNIITIGPTGACFQTQAKHLRAKTSFHTPGMFPHSYKHSGS